MIDVSIKFEGLEELRLELADLQSRMLSELEQAVTVTIDETIDDFRENHRYTDRTGDLTRLVYGNLTEITNRSVRGKIVWPVKYASYVDAGTGPHEIRAKRVPMLVFQGRSGKVVIGVVNTKGSKAFTFAGQAFHKAERVLEREMNARAERVVDAINALSSRL